MFIKWELLWSITVWYMMCSRFRSGSLSSPYGTNSFIHNFFFPSIVQYKLEVLQRKTAVELASVSRIIYSFY